MNDQEYDKDGFNLNGYDKDGYDKDGTHILDNKKTGWFGTVEDFVGSDRELIKKIIIKIF
jgi:hypothetical protein